MGLNVTHTNTLGKSMNKNLKEFKKENDKVV